MAESSSPNQQTLLKHGKTSFAAAAAAMSAGTLLSRLLGFVRDAVLVGLFDRTLTDAFVVGFRLPNLFRRLFGEGALSVSFIPIYMESLKKDPQRAAELSSAVFSALLALTTLLFVGGVIYMPEIMNLWVKDPQGYAAVPGKMELTIWLSRIMLGYLVLVTSYAFCMAVANSLGHFFWPALAPAVFNLAVILFSFLPAFQFHGDQLAWGVITGGAAQLLMVFVLLAKVGVRLRWSHNWRHPLFSQVLRNMAPGVLGLGVFQVMTLVNTSFAARLKEGAQSYIYCADRVLELPQSLIAISLGAALLPRFTHYLTDDRMDLLLNEAHRAVRALLFLALPSAVGMFFMSEAITDLLFGRGSFDAHDISMTAQVVAVYSLLLLASSVAKVLSPGFYAMKNTWLPAVVAIVCLVLHITLGSLFVDRLGLVGLALATTFSSLVNMTLLNFFFRRWLGPLKWPTIFWEMRRWVIGLVWIGLLSSYLHPFLKVWMGNTLSSLLTILLCVLGYFGSAAYFKAIEVEFVSRRFKKIRRSE